MSPQRKRYPRTAIGVASAPAAAWRAQMRRLGWLTIVAFSIKGAVSSALIVWALRSVA